MFPGQSLASWPQATSQASRFGFVFYLHTHLGSLTPCRQVLPLRPPPHISKLNELYSQLSTQPLPARNQVPFPGSGGPDWKNAVCIPHTSPDIELRPQTAAACSSGLAATVVTSYNLLPFHKDLISGLKGSRIILYPISVCLCELTMASFWHDSIFFQFISLRLGKGSLESERKEEKQNPRKRLLKSRERKTIFPIRSKDRALRARLGYLQAHLHFLISLGREVIESAGCVVCRCQKWALKPQTSMNEHHQSVGPLWGLLHIQKW